MSGRSSQMSNWKRHRHTGMVERSATDTSEAVGHADSLCVLLDVLNTVCKCHRLSIGDIGLICVVCVRVLDLASWRTLLWF